MARKNKKQSQKTFWTILIVVFGLLGVLFYSQNFNLVGGSVLGISNVQTLSGSGEIKEQMLFDVVINGGGESISGVILPNDVERFGVDKIPKAFTVEFALRDVTCNYRIESTDKSLFKIYQSTAVERDLKKNPPYNQVSLATTRNWCQNGGPSNLPKSVMGIAPEGGQCSDMKDIGTWGYWTPEQSNIILRNNMDSVNINGDWRATHVGGIPFYNVYDIGTRAFLEYNVDVKVTNSDGETVMTTLNSKDQTAILGEYGRVKIVGNLFANEFCDIPAIKYSIIENEEGKKFVQKSWVETYFNNYRNLISFDNDYFEYQWRNINIDPGIGAEWIFGTISGMNNALNQLSLQNPNTGCTIEGSTVKCGPETQVAYPEIQLMLDTSYIGISKDLQAERQKILDEIIALQTQDSDKNQARISSLQEQLNALRTDVTPVINLPTKGMPKLGTINNNDVLANDIGNIGVEITNVGTETDSFDVDLRCNNDISFGSRRVSLKPDETQNIELRFNGNAGSYSCEIMAKSVNNPVNSDSKSIVVRINERDIPKSPEELLDGFGSKTNNSDSILVLLLIGIMFVSIVIYFAKNRGKNKNSKK